MPKIFFFSALVLTALMAAAGKSNLHKYKDRMAPLTL